MYAVNPRIDKFEGDACYPDLKSIPQAPRRGVHLTNPRVTRQVVQQCVDLGIKHVWLHCMMGASPANWPSMTDAPGCGGSNAKPTASSIRDSECPNQFLKPTSGPA